MSGLFATVYFMGTTDQSQRFKVTVPVKNPTAKAAKRALTTSFGSICYGSLIIALIQTLRAIIRNAAEQARSEGNLFALFCLYCLDCILSIIESLAEYFNKVPPPPLIYIVCLYSSRYLRQGLLHCWKRYLETYQKPRRRCYYQ